MNHDAVATCEPVRIAANCQGRDFVVGDIHGHFERLARLLAHIGFDTANDRLFCLGDLIDRGPESIEALTLLEAPWVWSIRGNHEQMMLNAVGADTIDEQAHALWMMNGGDWYQTAPRPATLALIEAAKRLPFALEVSLSDGRRIGLVHAQVPLGQWSVLTRERDTVAVAEAALWARDQAERVIRRIDRPRLCALLAARDELQVADIDQVFHGHTPMPAPIAAGNTRWLDTGVFLAGGGLSISALGGETVWCLRDNAGEPETGWRTVD